MSRLIAEMLEEEERIVKLKVDNQSAIALSRNSVNHGRSKHIDTKYHFIRDCIETKKIELQNVSTEEQQVDVMTKSLPRQRFIEMRDKIDVKRLEPYDKLKGENVEVKLVEQLQEAQPRQPLKTPLEGTVARVKQPLEDTAGEKQPLEDAAGEKRLLLESGNCWRKKRPLETTLEETLLEGCDCWNSG